ncbi:methylated-DNA--[protein]-cysteine S-methyltransferase [Bacillus massilinigeriensis]|uniref:methylated-DNA--[protein]-cysteine S-methyltransferase n=1 Tax=Bacillus massilionigeriensis TaxID=1805475 RepID=UPI00096B1419|nr:methylated-DNA--[protein]-cysteine S-methyltransferase [Bacillus massilionigeriensis]
MEPNNHPVIHWTLLKYKDWEITVASTSKGLCYVGSLNKSIEELTEWANKRYPKRILVEDSETLKIYVDEIIEYLEGKRKIFSVPMDFDGTSFQLAVWNALCEIPYGETKSYSDIADMIHKPAAVRAVGTAIGANPVLIAVPCHRVVGKNGRLTGYRGGLDMKKQLLELEGISM